MKKTIKIFLASSITEFEKERNELEVFIRRISDIYEDNYDISLKPIRCEAIDPYITDSRTQDIINETLKDTELCIVLVYTRFGAFTNEEFKYALNLFRESNHKLPKIYVYFKKLEEGQEVSQSVLDFMDELDNNLHYYWSNFSNIDTVKLRIALSLTALNQNLKGIVLDDGKVTFEGTSLNEINLENVNEFQNHQELKELRKEYNKLDNKYYDLLPKYKKEPAKYFEEYSSLATDRKLLKDKIEKLEESILKLSKQLTIDGANGEMSNRQKAAYKAFEEGNLEEALDILDEEEMELDYRARRQKILEKQKKELQKNALIYLNELHTKIEILKSLEKYKDSTDKIISLYQKMLEVVFLEGVLINTYREYLDFIYEKYHNYSIPSFYEMMEKCNFYKHLLDALMLSEDPTLDVNEDDVGIYKLYQAIYLFEKNNSTQVRIFKVISLELFEEIKAYLLESISLLDTSIANQKYEYCEKLLLAYSYVNKLAYTASNEELRNENNELIKNYLLNYKHVDDEKYFSSLIYSLNELEIFSSMNDNDRKENLQSILYKSLEMINKNDVKYTKDAVVCYKKLLSTLTNDQYIFKDEFTYKDYNNQEGIEYRLKQSRELLKEKINILQRCISLISKVKEKDVRTYAPLLSSIYQDLSYTYYQKNDSIAAEHYYILNIEALESLIDIYEEGERKKSLLWQQLIINYKRLVSGNLGDISALPYYFSNDSELINSKHLLRYNLYLDKLREYRRRDILDMMLSLGDEPQPENYVLHNLVLNYTNDYLKESKEEAINFIHDTIIKYWKNFNDINKEKYEFYYLREIILCYSFIVSNYHEEFGKLYEDIMSIYSNYPNNEKLDSFIEEMKISYLNSLVNNVNTNSTDLDMIEKYNINIDNSVNIQDIYLRILNIYAKDGKLDKIDAYLDKYFSVSYFFNELEKKLFVMELYTNNNLIEVAIEYFKNFSEEELLTALQYEGSYYYEKTINFAKKINKEEYINSLINKNNK